MSTCFLGWLASTADRCPWRRLPIRGWMTRDDEEPSGRGRRQLSDPHLCGYPICLMTCQHTDSPQTGWPDPGPRLPLGPGHT
eukprot:6926506-Pyramimonas_sp.AAC.1